MARTKQILGTLAIVGVMMTLPACGGMRAAAARQKTSNDIKQVTLGYLNFSDNQKKPPADDKEFAAWATKTNSEEAVSLARLQALGYQVYWNVNISKLPAPGSGNTILIYPGDAATNGGARSWRRARLRPPRSSPWFPSRRPRPSGRRGRSTEPRRHRGRRTSDRGTGPVRASTRPREVIWGFGGGEVIVSGGFGGVIRSRHGKGWNRVDRIEIRQEDDEKSETMEERPYSAA